MSDKKTVFSHFQREVALRIKAFRQSNKLLQKDMSRFGYGLRHYQKIESGRFNLTLKTMCRLAQIFGVHISELFPPMDEQNGMIFHQLFMKSPFGVILWRLPDLNDRYSLELYDHNHFAEKAVHRDLSRLKAKKMMEIFPLADEQGLIDIFFEVITTGKSQDITRLIRYDRDFPLTVFSTKFVKCADHIGAAIFTDITEEYMAKAKIYQQKRELEKAQILPKVY